MKTTVATSVLFLVLALAKVNAAFQGKNVEEEEKPQPGGETPFPNFNNGPLTLRRIREELPQLIKNISSVDWKRPPFNQFFNGTPFAAPGGIGLNAFYNTLLSGVHSLYQDLLNRQQAFINLLTCGNCVNDGWNAIMEVALTVPELDWVYKPSPDKPSTFFTAVHSNGTVTGIGGSIVNDKPVPEYAFGNDGIIQHLPDKHKKEILNKP